LKSRNEIFDWKLEKVCNQPYRACLTAKAGLNMGSPGKGRDADKKLRFLNLYHIVHKVHIEKTSLFWENRQGRKGSQEADFENVFTRSLGPACWQKQGDPNNNQGF
jgi:hypothetical protein